MENAYKRLNREKKILHLILMTRIKCNLLLVLIINFILLPLFIPLYFLIDPCTITFLLILTIANILFYFIIHRISYGKWKERIIISEYNVYTLTKIIEIKKKEHDERQNSEFIENL